MTLTEKLEQTIEQLSCSTFYPHPVEVITTIETHISIVFLTGSFAYKLKKPVNFGFLNFSTLPLRKKFSELEIKLNRRTAPELYIDCLAVYQTNNQLTLIPNQAPPVEYLIKMHQFDPNKVLGRYLTQHTLSKVQIKSLVENIAQLHIHAEACDPHCEYGQASDVIHPMLDNFSSLIKSFHHPDQQYRLKQLASWTSFTQKQLYNPLTERKRQGFIKACHGDMHLDNITLIQDRPVLFDGIEFNEQFRWIDTISDLAFLIVDCDYRQQISLRRQIINQYFNLTGDYSGLELLNFYLVYRAMVRAKISALRYHQLPPKSTEAALTFKTAEAFLKQAEDYAYDLKRPQIILMQGVAGSGKSFYAQQLLEEIDAIILNSDIERKRLFGIKPLERVADNEKSCLYSPEMTLKTYQTLLNFTKTLISAEICVIVDATFLKFSQRQAFQQLAKEFNVPFKILSIGFEQEMIEQNLRMRSIENETPSDANIQIMNLQKSALETFHLSEPYWQIKPKSEITKEEIFTFLNRDIQPQTNQ